MHTNRKKSTIVMIALIAFQALVGITGFRQIFALADYEVIKEKIEFVNSNLMNNRLREQTEGKNTFMTTDIKPAKLIRMVYPAYSQNVKVNGIEGVVILEASTDESGFVETVRVLMSIPELDQLAIDAIKKWVFEPITIKGEPKGIIFTVTCWFSPDIKNSEIALLGGITGKDKKPPIRVAGDIKTPKLIKKVKPNYSQDAKDASIEGEIIIEATTDINGHVQDVKILKSIPELDKVAIDAVEQWIYEPMIIEGKPRGLIFTITLTFSLNYQKETWCTLTML